MKILSRPKGAAEEYGRWSVNPYLGCSNDCTYCYLKSGPGAATLGGNTAHLKAGVKGEEHAYHLAMAEIIENRDEIIRDGGLFMTFTSDPYLPATRRLMSRIIKDCIQSYEVPVTILTKRADVFPLAKRPSFEDVERCKEWATSVGCFAREYETLNKRLATGFTLTGHDEMEPNASSNADRIKAIQFLHGLNLNVWASIEPVIDFKSSYAMIEQALDAGCRHFKIGLQTVNNKVLRDRYDAVECMAFVQDVMQLTRDRATVYWKQSVRQFIGGTPKHRLFTDAELHDIFDRWPHSVPATWSMFGKEGDAL